jgi:hypothetical protein
MLIAGLNIDICAYLQYFATEVFCSMDKLENFDNAINGRGW